jgi:glycosyltransferase involved in cell wall biosynthesis
VSVPVTIVTPSYNQGEFIRETIESVLSQDYPNVEYIIMDGGSTDHTAAIAGEYAGRLTWIQEADRGQAHAINKGFARARGEIVAWLNSDDILLPGAVRRAVDAFARAPHAGAIYGDGYLMDREGRRTGRFPETQPFNLWRLTYLSDYVLQQSTFFRRAAVDAVGGLDETLHYALDWDLLIRLGTKFGLQYVPEDFGVLREYSDAKSFSGGSRRIQEIRRVLERHTGLRRAPGYWIYALDTVQRGWQQRLVDRAPRWLRFPGRLAHLTVYVPAAVAIMCVLRYAQGWTPDGWASDRMSWLMPEGRGDVVIRGRLPDDPALRGMTLRAVVAGREVGAWTLAPGPFVARFTAPETAGALPLELRASRYRRVFRGRDGGRRLAFQLTAIEWADHPYVSM